MSEIASATGTLFTYPRENDAPKDHGEVKLVISHVEKFDYSFDIYRGDHVLFSQIIDDDMSLTYQGQSLDWFVARADGKPPSRLSLKFDDDNDDYKGILLVIARALIESKLQKDISQCYEEEDRDWAVESQLPVQMKDEENEYYDFEDVEPNPVSMDDDSTEGVSQPLFKKSEVYKATTPSISSFTDKNKNSLMTSGFVNNRTFVTRGPTLGVFSYNSNDELEYISKISNIKRPDGTILENPSQIQLHESDNRLIILDKDNQNSVYNMDIETGKIIDKWSRGENIGIKSIAPRSKYAQTTDENLIIGVSNNAFFSMDPRLNTGNKLAEEVSYTTKNNGLSNAATTGEGYVAVGSETGEVRLFSKIQKGYCKTLLPGLGGAITHIEVTEDGSWLLATTDKCLILFNLVISGSGDKNEGKLGFSARMGKFKPTPYLLKISAADMVKFNIGSAKFTPARFNTGTIANTKEEFITTSTGPFIITWDFNKIKKGVLSAYSIRPTGDKILEDYFRHNYKEQLAVAQGNQIFSSRLETRKRKY